MDPKLLSIGQSILIKRSDGIVAARSSLPVIVSVCLYVYQDVYMQLPSVALTQKSVLWQLSGLRTMKPKGKRFVKWECSLFRSSMVEIEAEGLM